MYRGKTALIVGLARSGISAAKLLYRLGATIIISDIKEEDDLAGETKELRESIECDFLLGSQPDEAVAGADLIVISPGIPTDNDFVKKARQAGKKVISEIELAYTLCKAPIVAITGTNGKTTTTSLAGAIFQASDIKTHVVGNIGVPFTDKVLDTLATDIAVVEVSSFQLETIYDFKPKISVILNITEDHLNRHKTMENYTDIKLRIYSNQSQEDYIVLNADDIILSGLGLENKDQVYWFSRKKVLEKGAWVEDNDIYMDIGAGEKRVCAVDEVAMPGSHNLENALAAVLIGGLMGAKTTLIGPVLKSFPGVEHRIERVDTIRGISFYNDSKATNPSASIKAIQAMAGPTLLIAGGLDKQNEFEELIQAFGDKVKALIVLGETADKLAAVAYENDFTNIHKTNSIEEAVNIAFKLSSPGYSVLLSPACASWDMFKDYEERGRAFKEAVKALRR
ncbi:MAG TPA: UDP-N-acetylmuramoyl-L-alanine--D-glutamate ligase [Bacillota bacterium]|nr:UDP-N-acetylmuramoyl-L-alanine--D-glutamate ligase [Bacillota bacterium]